jgi:hypothetical protein
MEETQTNVINSTPISVIKKVKFTSIPCKPETRQALRELVQGKETWDALLLRMVEKCKQTP